jgi:hypothetical protein
MSRASIVGLSPHPSTVVQGNKAVCSFVSCVPEHGAKCLIASSCQLDAQLLFQAICIAKGMHAVTKCSRAGEQSQKILELRNFRSQL